MKIRLLIFVPAMLVIVSCGTAKLVIANPPQRFVSSSRPGGAMSLWFSFELVERIGRRGKALRLAGLFTSGPARLESATPGLETGSCPLTYAV
jgi:hypothetical protein